MVSDDYDDVEIRPYAFIEDAEVVVERVEVVRDDVDEHNEPLDEEDVIEVMVLMVEDEEVEVVDGI